MRMTTDEILEVMRAWIASTHPVIDGAAISSTQARETVDWCYGEGVSGFLDDLGVEVVC